MLSSEGPAARPDSSTRLISNSGTLKHSQREAVLVTVMIGSEILWLTVSSKPVERMQEDSDESHKRPAKR